MHKVMLSEEILARARLLRGGSEHLFDRLDMPKVAHLVVDMQLGFIAESSPLALPAAREIIDNVNTVSRAIRAGGGTNVFLRFAYDPAEPVEWRVFYADYGYEAQRSTLRDTFGRDAAHFALHPALDVRPDDLVVDKTRFSAFIPGTCGLDAILNARGIDTLIISGTATNCCCEATARDAMQMNYKVVFLSDATATFTDTEHNASLNSMAAIFVDIMDTQHLLGVIRESREAAGGSAAMTDESSN